jgi:hypothetical protein
MTRPKFTKQHHEAIAMVMQHTHPSEEQVEYDYLLYQWEMVVNELARTFASDDATFKRVWFINACDPGSNVKTGARIRQ